MDVSGVKRNIEDHYHNRLPAAVLALCLNYAARAINTFRANQLQEMYWKNQTGQARDRMFASGYLEDDVAGWFMAHGVQYGVYLELANDRKHEAIRPVMESLIPEFMNDLRAICGWGLFQL